MTFGNHNHVSGPSYSNPYGYSNAPAIAPQGGYGYEQLNVAPMQQPYGQGYPQASQPTCMHGLVVPGTHGGSYDLSKISRLSQADFKFLVECSQYTRGDFAPMVKHCVNTTLSWANRLDADGGVDAFMIDGTQQAAVRVVRGAEQGFAEMVSANQSSRRPVVASVLRTVAIEMLAKVGSRQPVAPQVLLFAVSGHHLDADDIIDALTHVKDTLKSMGHEHPERMLMVGFIKVGERGGLLDSAKNSLRKLDNHKVVGRMIECDVDVAKNMEERIFGMLERFCHPETNGDNKLAGLAQNMFSKVLG